MDADGEGATATEGVERGAFGFDGEPGVGMLEEGDGLADVGIAGLVDWILSATGFESKRALAGGGTDLLGGEALVDGLGAL